MNNLNLDNQNESPKWTLISEWKTKIIWNHKTKKYRVIIESKNNLSAWDGARKDKFDTKALLSTNITANFFEYLNRMWIKSHYLSRISDTEILCKKCEMIPVEVVYRQVATGSYIDREKSQKWKNATKNWTILEKPIYELFYKNDAVSTEDMKIKWWFKIKKWTLVPKKPIIWPAWVKLEYLVNNENRVLEDLYIPSWSILPAWFAFSDPVMQISDWKVVLDKDGKAILMIAKSWEVIKSYEIWTPKEDDKRLIPLAEYKKHINQTNKFAKQIHSDTVNIIKHLVDYLSYVWLSLFDIKLEFWLDKDWKLNLADVVDAESWRYRRNITVIWDDWNEYMADNINEEILKKAKLWSTKDWVKITSIQKMKSDTYALILKIWDKIEKKIITVLLEWVNIKQVSIEESFDKEWFRQWEPVSATRQKYETLDRLTSEASAYLLSNTQKNTSNDIAKTIE